MSNLLYSFVYLIIGLSLFSTQVNAATPPKPADFVRGVVDEEPAPSGTTKSISQYGITWNFSSAVTYGQFVTGDYWVIDPGGGVKVTIMPAPSGGRNGSQVNPTSGKQPFDNRETNSYDSALTFYSGGTVKAGDSLISTVSDTSSAREPDVLGRDVANEHSWVNSAAVLTVLSSPPSANSFRPPIFGTKKPIYDYDNVNLSKLANMPASTNKPSHVVNSSWTVAQNYASYLKRPWINWGNDWLGRYIHPLSNMPNYYEYCYYVYSEAGLIINSDMEGKEEVLKGLIQLGIDTKFATDAGRGDRTVSKFPMLVAGLMLGEPSLYTSSFNGFKEILQTYYGNGWSTPTPSVLWRQKTNNPHEQAHPSNWRSMYVSTQGSLGAGKLETYRRCCSSNSWTGIALSIRAMDATNEWGHDAFLDYVDRWHYEAGSIDSANRAIISAAGYSPSGWGDSGSTESGFTSEMWRLHRWKY